MSEEINVNGRQDWHPVRIQLEEVAVDWDGTIKPVEEIGFFGAEPVEPMCDPDGLLLLAMLKHFPLATLLELRERLNTAIYDVERGR